MGLDEHDADDQGSPSYVAGALAGGIGMGVASAFLNCCCFVFGPIGGAVAAWAAARTTFVFGAQEGAIAGACAGALGWLVQAVIAVPMALFAHQLIGSNQQLLNMLPPELRQMYLRPPEMGPIVLGQVMTLGVLAVTSTLGGLVAGQTFLRKDPWSHRGYPAPEGAPVGPPGSGEKACPQCGETIKAVAVKCRFCGSAIGPNPPPPA